MAARSKEREVARIVVGWIEPVTLPDLGLGPFDAKIDTGARTSALHVGDFHVTDAADARGRRWAELVIPAVGRRRARVVRVRVVGHASVRASSGVAERRPVIETTLLLGPLRQRVLVTLTNRGDMTYPMLVGRTALPRGVLVDPSARRCWSRREDREHTQTSPRTDRKS